MIAAKVTITALVQFSLEIEKSAGVASRSIELAPNQTNTLSPAEFASMQAILVTARTNGYISFTDPVDSMALYCTFIVDHANGNGLGLRTLKGPGIKSVFMHTSAPLVGSGNPNPQAGVVLVEFQSGYEQYVFGSAGFVTPVSGTPLAVDATALTIGNAYVIVSLGTSTAADWLALGVPAGVPAAVGLPFIAAAVGAGAGSGMVEAPAASGAGVDLVEVIGDGNLSTTTGKYLISGCYAATSSSVTTKVLTAPADGTVIAMKFVVQELGSLSQS